MRECVCVCVCVTQELIRDEVALAAAGESSGALPVKNARLTLSELQEKCETLKQSCEELRARRVGTHTHAHTHTHTHTCGSARTNMRT